MPKLPTFLLFLSLSLFPFRGDGQSAASTEAVFQLGEDKWRRKDRHDGYVAGNGQVYMIGGLGRALSRSGKSALTEKPVSLTRIAWIVGPHYPIGNLGYGWELLPELAGKPVKWESESLAPPTDKMPFWGVHCTHPGLTAEVADVVIPGEPVVMRKMVIRRPAGLPPVRAALRLPAFADERNGYYAMFDGSEVDFKQSEKWKRSCGPYLRPRPSVPFEKLIRARPEEKAIITLGAARALWQEISTLVPNDDDYPRIFPPRALAAAVSSTSEGVDIRVDERGFHLDLGEMAGGDSLTLALWLATDSAPEEELEGRTLELLNKWRSRDPEQVLADSRRKLPEPILTRLDKSDDPYVDVLRATTGLCIAGQAASGGVWAQPYMYPMYYVRDQYGSFRMFIALGEHERALRILNFYVAMQNRDGIQNAHDGPVQPPDPTDWRPDANEKNGFHSRAEVPSYIILMARDYYRATGDLESLQPLYPRLAYNLRIQEFSRNGVQPWATDESYTNSRQTHPRFRDEMSDSQILFIAAADFMAELAEKTGRKDDAADFGQRARSARAALIERLWLPDANYFAFARDAGDDPQQIDRRPAFDLLLRWFWLELDHPMDAIPQGCLKAVTDSLVNPIRVVPEYEWCAGMDPGYLLYALARSQHPQMHQAARLMMNYASDNGLFSEYYAYRENTIIPQGGTLRPWESAINGASLLQYLLGLRLDIPNRKVFLQPHLPPHWEGWQTKEIDLGVEGKIKFLLKRQDSTATLAVWRTGGANPLDLEVELGGFGPIAAVSEQLAPVAGRQDVLATSLTLNPGPTDGETPGVEVVFEVR